MHSIRIFCLIIVLMFCAGCLQRMSMDRRHPYSQWRGKSFLTSCDTYLIERPLSEALLWPTKTKNDTCIAKGTKIVVKSVYFREYPCYSDDNPGLFATVEVSTTHGNVLAELNLDTAFHVLQPSPYLENSNAAFPTTKPAK